MMETEKGKRQESPVVKQAYESPTVEVIKLETEGVIAGSYPGGAGHDYDFD